MDTEVQYISECSFLIKQCKKLVNFGDFPWVPGWLVLSWWPVVHACRIMQPRGCSPVTFCIPAAVPISWFSEHFRGEHYEQLTWQQIHFKFIVEKKMFWGCGWSSSRYFDLDIIMHGKLCCTSFPSLPRYTVQNFPSLQLIRPTLKNSSFYQCLSDSDQSVLQPSVNVRPR